jgi:hypothetical protein
MLWLISECRIMSKWHVSHLILEIYGSIEVRDFGVDRFAHDLSFACMEEGSHFYQEQLAV